MLEREFASELGVKMSEWVGERKASGERDLEVLWPEFVSEVLIVAENRIGSRVKTKDRRKGARHWNRELEVKRERREALKRKRKHRTAAAKQAYRVAHNDVRNALAKERMRGWKGFCDELEHCDRNAKISGKSCAPSMLRALGAVRPLD